MINRIRFSHNYPKLRNQHEAVLLMVSEITVDNAFLKSRLHEIDTITNNGHHYELKKGKYIILLFEGNQGYLFTTIRSMKPGKKEYYQGKINELFNLEIAGE